MAEEPTLDQLKQKLLELINSSEALKTISDEEKSERIELMMKGSKEDIQGYIQVFEDELKEINEIDTELQSHADEIQEAIDTEKYDKIKTDRQEELAKETALKESDDKAAEKLLNELEKVSKPKVKADKIVKTVKKTKEININKVLRGFLAAMIGMVSCGFGGLLVVYAVIFFMGKYEHFQVAFSSEPLILFHAYWIALAFGALIGLFLMPILRLIKTKSTFLSGILGGVVGAVIVALSHMIFGLNYDVSILIDKNPIPFRGYWAAFIFAILIGFFAQLVSKMINHSSIFKIEEK